jgi:hypothetical protein
MANGFDMLTTSPLNWLDDQLYLRKSGHEAGS